MEEDDVLDIDIVEDADVLQSEVTQYFQDISGCENLEAIGECITSVETMNQVIPILSQETEAVEFLKLDTPNYDFIKSQLNVANEGMIENFISGAVPFIDLYLHSASRLAKVLTADKAHLPAPADINLYRFGGIKAFHLDLKDQFMEKIKALKLLVTCVQQNAGSVSVIDELAVNRALAEFGLVLNSRVHNAASAIAEKLPVAVSPVAPGIAIRYYVIKVAEKVSTLEAHAQSMQLIADSYAKERNNPWWKKLFRVTVGEDQLAADKATHNFYQGKAVAAFEEAGKVANKISRIKVVSAYVGLSTLVAGLISVGYSALRQIMSHTIVVKGWKPKDVAPAITATIAALNDDGAIRTFHANLKRSYKDMYARAKASEDKVTMGQLKQNYKLLTKLTSFYTLNLTAMARGVHEMCEQIK